ncbi:DNA-binding protein [Anaerosporobacter sp.]|uniref:DNA-binding protein n=1 Tax=Anaerosporobacter sp. TaxID=1872529 RepID=UPI00286ED319|nr:DNA-binding protein [Anaerosporobacter sp.]
MYKNLLNVMKLKNVTAVQISNLLECRQATTSDKLNGKVECGFYFSEAQKIRQVFFPEYDYDWLFTKDNLVA